MNPGRTHQRARAMGWALFHSALVSFLASLASAAESNTVSQPSNQHLDRTNLLVFHNAKGEIIPVKSKDDWLKRRAEILAAMQQVMGPLPGKEKRCPLDVKVDEEVDCGSYMRQFLTYAAEPESRVPAYLLIPKAALNGEKTFPAVL